MDKEMILKDQKGFREEPYKERPQIDKSLQQPLTRLTFLCERVTHLAQFIAAEFDGGLTCRNLKCYKELEKFADELNNLVGGEIFFEVEGLLEKQETTDAGYCFFVDHNKYEWAESTIIGVQLRKLAEIPANVEIFLVVPGQLDAKITNEKVIDLRHTMGPTHFSTQSIRKT